MEMDACLRGVGDCREGECGVKGVARGIFVVGGRFVRRWWFLDVIRVIKLYRMKYIRVCGTYIYTRVLRSGVFFVFLRFGGDMVF